jgi:hypothetical protein
MAVSGQLHRPAALSSGKCLTCPSNRLGVTKNMPGSFFKEENIYENLKTKK